MRFLTILVGMKKIAGHGRGFFFSVGELVDVCVCPKMASASRAAVTLIVREED